MQQAMSQRREEDESAAKRRMKREEEEEEKGQHGFSRRSLPMSTVTGTTNLSLSPLSAPSASLPLRTATDSDDDFIVETAVNGEGEEVPAATPRPSSYSLALPSHSSSSAFVSQSTLQLEFIAAIIAQKSKMEAASADTPAKSR